MTQQETKRRQKNFAPCGKPVPRRCWPPCTTTSIACGRGAGPQGVGGGIPDRYGRIRRHGHPVCNSCVRLPDTDLGDLTAQLEEKAGGSVLSYDLKLTCLCEECRKKKFQRKGCEEAESSAIIRPRRHRGGQSQYCALGRKMHPLRDVQGGLYQSDGGTWNLHAGRDRGKAVCIYCGQCANVCPVDSITERDETAAVRKAIADPDKVVVISTSPAVRAALGEEFDREPGAFVEGKWWRCCGPWAPTMCWTPTLPLI